MSIDCIVSRLFELEKELAPMKKEYDALRKQVLEYMDGRDIFETAGHVVTVKTTTSTRLDTTALYKDFPDIKEVYNRPTVSRSVSVHEKQADAKSA